MADAEEDEGTFTESPECFGERAGVGINNDEAEEEEERTGPVLSS